VAGQAALRAPALPLADASVRRILCPLRACLGSAVHEGRIRANPCAGAALPTRSTDFDADEPDEVKALTTGQLATFLAIVDPRHRTVFRLLASMGPTHQRGPRPPVATSAARRRATARQGPARDRQGSDGPAEEQARAPRGPALVVAGRFRASGGAIIDQSNLRRRVMMPAAQEAATYVHLLDDELGEAPELPSDHPVAHGLCSPVEGGRMRETRQ
jgi:hypothetical protein